MFKILSKNLAFVFLQDDSGQIQLILHPRDFDEWESQGAQGWGYANCLPYFQKAENWTDGGDCVVVPSIPTEEARQKFPKGITEVKPYLRMTPQPNK